MRVNPSVEPSGGQGEMGTSLGKALLVARTAEEHRGHEIVILDMRELTSLFDYFVIVSGTSRRQLHAISEHIDGALSQVGARRLGVEGFGESRWILLDYGEVIVHLFEPETRAYYALEDLWAHAPRVTFESRQPLGQSTGTHEAT